MINGSYLFTEEEWTIVVDFEPDILVRVRYLQEYRISANRKLYEKQIDNSTIQLKLIFFWTSKVLCALINTTKIDSKVKRNI